MLVQPGALADAIVRRLKEVGADPVVVEHSDTFETVDAAYFRVRAGAPEDTSMVARQVHDARGPIQGVIYLWSVPADDSLTAIQSYHALVAFVEGLASEPQVRVIVATFGAASVLDEPARDPIAAMALGPVLTLPTEVPGLVMRAVDLDMTVDANAAEIAETLVEEAANVDGESVVARRAGRRWVRRLERLPLPPADPTELPVKPRGVYLITGGLGGIGLTLAHWFAANTSARLALTARTPFAPREQWDKWLAEHGPDDQTVTIIRSIRDIEASGGDVLTIAADVADFNQMKRAIELARERWGGIDGVVHAAGVPGTGRIAFLKQPDDVRSVFAPKVDGLDVLVRLLGKTPLDFVALTSSVSSVLGTPGVCDYAGANAVLDAFPESKSCPASWKQVVSIDWGPWRDIGMAAKFFESNARADPEVYQRTTIPPKAGADAFARVLGSRNKRVIVVPFNLTQYLDLLRKGPTDHAVIADRPTPHAGVPTQAAQGCPEIAGAYQPPATETERRLAEIWTSLLGVERIGLDDNFFDLGGHSLLATRMLARIGDLFHVRLTLRNIFDASTVRGLAAEISRVASPSDEIPMSDEREEIVF